MLVKCVKKCSKSVNKDGRKRHNMGMGLAA